MLMMCDKVFEMTDVHIEYSKRQFLLLWFFCLIGSWSVFPYIYYLGILPSSVSIQNIFFIKTIQDTIFFGIACYVSYKILPKTDLHPFIVKNIFKQILLPGVISGISIGLIIFSLDKMVFHSPLAGVHPPFWAGALASIYGAVNEEVLLRLFLFTLIYFIFRKLFKYTNDNRLLFLWIVNITVSIIFGISHLPPALKLTTPSSFEIFRILLLNGIPGIVFGWLYWSRGLWTAMLAHFVTDLVIHVLLI